MFILDLVKKGMTVLEESEEPRNDELWLRGAMLWWLPISPLHADAAVPSFFVELIVSTKIAFLRAPSKRGRLTTSLTKMWYREGYICNKILHIALCPTFHKHTKSWFTNMKTYFLVSTSNLIYKYTRGPWTATPSLIKVMAKKTKLISILKCKKYIHTWGLFIWVPKCHFVPKVLARCQNNLPKVSARNTISARRCMAPCSNFPGKRIVCAQNY